MNVFDSWNLEFVMLLLFLFLLVDVWFGGVFSGRLVLIVLVLVSLRLVVVGFCLFLGVWRVFDVLFMLKIVVFIFLSFGDNFMLVNLLVKFWLLFSFCLRWLWSVLVFWCVLRLVILMEVVVSRVFDYRG